MRLCRSSAEGILLTRLTLARPAGEQGINCGGLGDRFVPLSLTLSLLPNCRQTHLFLPLRLLGMTSAFFFGLMTQRAVSTPRFGSRRVSLGADAPTFLQFLAEWQSPVPLDVIFDSPHIDWSHSSYTADQHPVLGQKRLASAAADLDIIHFDRLSVDATFGTVSWNPKIGRKPTPGFERRDMAYQSPWIKVRSSRSRPPPPLPCPAHVLYDAQFYTNRGMIYRSFKYKHLQKSIERLGLQPTTAFACISEYLFKPKPPALDLITQYTSVLALPTVFSVGIHVRTGDQSMRDPEYDKVNTGARAFLPCSFGLSAPLIERG